ncbi:DUF3429 domain-containing protein [Oceanicaulis sp. MMSF_3324]|uniref:DUF3429 domain-containing protein n=1 Tax=Oceanicaulis sp. MMSF_3324 TaxID=3046702 RepID=UPI00273FAF7F|nr:DUF3429 domain-containing protein [Oceanicaulis sp. MMSF_3324]
MQRLSEAPPLVLILGFGGLLPFLAGAIGVMAGGQAALQAATALPVYSAVILSFLAGGRWAGELVIRSDKPRSGVMMLSILLSLAGWIAVVIQVWNRPGLPLDLELTGWGILIAGFVVQFLWDRTAIRGATFPGWYMPLRFILTAVVVLCLGLTAFVRSSPTFSL